MQQSNARIGPAMTSCVSHKLSTAKADSYSIPRRSLSLAQLIKMRVRGVLSHMTNFSFRLRAWRNWVTRSLTAVVFLSLSFASISQEANKPKEGSNAAAVHTGTTVGSQVFHARCISCHNQQPGDNSPFGPPNLFSEFKRKAITHSQAEVVIVHGKGTMPPFGTVLSKGEIQRVIEYLNKGK